MNEKTAITELTIDLPGQQLKLSPENARKLYQALGKLFAAEDKPDLAEIMKQMQELRDRPQQPIIVYPSHPVLVPTPLQPSWPHWPGQPWLLGDLQTPIGSTCGGTTCSTLHMDLRG